MTLDDEPALQPAGTVLRALIATGRGELGVAESLYRSALEQDGQNVVVLNNLADVLVRSGAQCTEAVLLAERAVALTSGDPNILDTLAMAHLCAGNHTAAEQQIRRGLSRDPQNPVLLTTLAGILHGQARPVQAKTALENARHALRRLLQPDPEILHRIEQLSREIDAAYVQRRSETN